MKVWKVIGIIVVCLALVSLIGCGKTEKEPAPETQAQPEATQMSATDYTPTPEDVGAEATCPVCNMKVTVAEDTPAAMYDGKVYYFCSPDDKATFMADPGKYAAGTEKPMEDMGGETESTGN